MAGVYVIAEACVDVKDRSCIEVCPVDCIHTTDEDRMCFIDPSSCTSCNLCLPACPVGAIFVDGGRPAASQVWTAFNANYFIDRDSTRAAINEYVS